METKWLEDFLSLAETRSFSRSAQLRRITQPAFSRRIQALEAWAGTDLVDRSSYPTRLTAAGESVHAQAIEILASLQFTSNLLLRHMSDSQDTIEFSVPHALAATWFPGWIGAIADEMGPIRSRLVSLTEHDAVLRLAEGTSDFLVVYHHPSQPMQISTDRYEMLSVGDETFAPYCRSGSGSGGAQPLDRSAAPMFALAGVSQSAVPFLGYTPGSYLGRLAEQIVRQAQPSPDLHLIYESDMVEGLAVMASQGHGVAFLPSSFARDGFSLTRAGPIADPAWELTLEVRVYRERLDVTRRSKPAAMAFWEHLRARE
ncbi:LysR substrate-binding domain-containing protein [soil metagenome]